MTTRAEEIAAEGPYTARYDNGRYVLDGPTPTVGFWALEEWDAQNHADDLNAAYRQGQRDRWIPVKDEEPANGQLVLVWAMEHPDKAQSAPGFHLLSWVRHGALHWPRFATWRSRVTHWMRLPSPPNPEQR